MRTSRFSCCLEGGGMSARGCLPGSWGCLPGGVCQGGGGVCPDGGVYARGDVCPGEGGAICQVSVCLGGV